MNDEFSDHWSEWLLYRRHGGDAQAEHRIRTDTMGYADRVLDGARLDAGMTLADIGTGDGLIAFRAMERVGASLKVLMTDISRPMLDHVKALAAQRGVLEQCVFLEGSADALAGIDDCSVDVITTRAVLAYVADKPAALREFYRILRPGGRLSICEPIMRDEALEVCALRKIVEAQRAQGDFQDPFPAMLLRWRSAQYPDTEERVRATPITNYDERDLVRYAIGAGFSGIHLAFHIDMQTLETTSWDALLQSSPHPLAPSLGAILEDRFTPDERRIFEAKVRGVLESDSNLLGMNRIAWMTAEKPGAA